MWQFDNRDPFSLSVLVFSLNRLAGGSQSSRNIGAGHNQKRGPGPDELSWSKSNPGKKWEVDL
jgi:hypothetical protein